MFMKFWQKLKKEQGFTLIELMVVVFVIGVLASIAAPVYSNVQKQAKESVGKANANMLNRGVEMYKMFGDGEDPANGGEGTFDPEEDEDHLLAYLGLEEVEHVKWDASEEEYISEPDEKLPGDYTP